MKESRAILNKLISLTIDIDFQNQRLEEEKRCSSIYRMFGNIHPPQETRRVRAKIEKITNTYNELKLEL